MELRGTTNSSSMFIVMVDAAELVVPLSLPQGILRHIEQFQVIFQQTEAGSPYTKELPD